MKIASREQEGRKITKKKERRKTKGKKRADNCKRGKLLRGKERKRRERGIKNAELVSAELLCLSVVAILDSRMNQILIRSLTKERFQFQIRSAVILLLTPYYALMARWGRFVVDWVNSRQWMLRFPWVQTFFFSAIKT